MASKTTNQHRLMGAGQRIVIDPATGQIRPIEHDDTALIAPSAATAQAEPEQFVASDGSINALVPDTSDVYTVATKAPDGNVSIGHAVGLTEATRKMQAADKARPNGAKEALNER
jgi:hypothetical protein